MGPNDWRDHAVSPWSWRRAPNQAGGADPPAKGEAGGFFVMCDDLGGCRAYLKPLKTASKPNEARAAREKIVSDLAYDLAFSVPPVLLTERTDNKSGEEKYACVSKVLYPRQWPWQMVKRLVIDPSSSPKAGAIVMAAMPRAAAEGLALDTWVSQPDHNDHPHNILFGYEPGGTDAGAFVFLDFAWALGFAGRWEGDLWKKGDPVPFPPHMLRFCDRDALRQAVERIEKLPESGIREIVTRVPEPYLTNQQKEEIITGLLGRQTLVRTILAPQLQKGTP